MRNKAYILTLLTILGISLMGACSKAERVSDDNEIVLSPYASSLTKADPDLGPLGTDKVFGVYAYNSACAGGTAWNDASAWAASSQYFANAAFSYQETAWSGTPAPYYWPLSGSLMFAGYCPHSGASDGAVTAVSLENTDKTDPCLQISFTQNSSATVDLLWFDVKDVAEGKTLSKTSDAIPLTFKHALSKVTFTFIGAENHYQISSLTLKGLVNQGTFTSGNTPTWALKTAKPDVTLLAESQDMHNLTSEAYIIPQGLSTAVLAFTITDTSGDRNISLPLKDYTTNWELGKSYIYTIIANKGGFKFDTVRIEDLELGGRYGFEF